MPSIVLISASLTIFFATVLLGLAAVDRTSRATSTRALQIASGRFEPSAIVQSAPAARRSSLKLLRDKSLAVVRDARSRMGMSDDEKLIARFASAGFKGATSRDIYFAARFIGPVFAVLLCSLLPSNHFAWMCMAGGIFYLGPDLVLQRLIKRRTDKIRRGVPDAIDLLVICVDAGLGLDQAMLRVAQELSVSHPHIREEFAQINREQRAGKLRIEAWKAMAARCKLPEIDGFVDMLLQTDRFGTPIARALSNYGDNIRQKRKQRAEELAAKTTVKIIFPLVLCIFPSIFIVLLGPAALTISRGMAVMTQ